MRIYLAGPVAGMPSIEAARENFEEAADAIKTLGHIPIIPLDIVPTCGNTCSGPRDKVGSDHAGYQHSRKCYMRHDFIDLLQADAVCMVPGWENSTGANREHDIAKWAGMEIHSLSYWTDLEAGF